MAGPALRVELLGGFRISANGRLPRTPLTTRQQQLVACLALHGQGPMSRQQIAGRLWPESTEAQALTNLRRELHHLRHASPEVEAAIDAGSRTLAWRDGFPLDVDVEAFEHAVRLGSGGERNALEEAARLYRGDLFPACSEDWILPERERLRQSAASALAQLIGLLEEENASGDAIARAQQLLQIDPVHEGAWCALMRSHARRGERATALHLYQQCASVLRRELGVQPGPATRLTYRELLDLGEADTSAQLPPPRTQVYPLVGRHAEWSMLLRTWQAAAAGRPRLAVIRGEAGIGKTRLAEELVDWCASKGVRTAATRCYAAEGRLAYAPLASWLQSEAVAAPSMALDPMWLTEVARLRPELLLARTDVTPPEPKLENWQRSRFFEALSRAFQSAAPLLLVVDDLQWCDAETFEWLHFFLRSTADARCLLVGTLRAEEVGDNEALGILLSEVERLDCLTVLQLGPLDEAATARLAEEVAERPLDARTQARMFRQTEGHPLFVVETGRMALTPAVEHTTEALPPRVQSVVAARLARLSEHGRAVVEVAAVIGRDFTFDVLAQVSDLEEDAVVRALDELWRRQIVRVQANEYWDFTHDRIREVAYGAIGPARRRLLHRRVGQAIELLSASDLDHVSASIAAHLERGGFPARAIPFLERAARIAVLVSANEEAIRCLSRALSLVEQMPPGRDRDKRELALRSSLSASLTWARGYAAPEVEDNLERVAALASSLGRGNVPVRWLWGLWTLRFMLGNLKAARELSERALAIGLHDPACVCEAHHAMAATLASLGELEPARHHFEAAIAAYDERHPQRSALGSDLGVFAHAWYAHDLWLLGRAEDARTHAEEAIALSRRLDHPYSQALALAYGALTYQLCRDVGKVREYAQGAVALCDRHGFAYYGDWARVLLGWVLGQEQHASDGVSLIESAIERLDGQRAHARRPYYLSLLAETYIASGRRDQAAAILDTAIAVVSVSDEAWWLPELHRQKGALDSGAGRERSFRQALKIARDQNSAPLERRVTESMNLA